MNYIEYKNKQKKEESNRLFNQSKIKEAFVKRLKQKEFSTTLFELNCHTLGFIICKNFPHNEAASYDLISNDIFVKKKNYIDYIWHELLHVSSTLRTEDVIYSGLSISNGKKEKIGTGLNEGVTVFLDGMLFKGITKNHDKYNQAYPIEKFLCGILYDIIGEFLFKCYFDADFDTFYSYLVNFNGFKKTDNFLKAFDIIYFESHYTTDKKQPNIKSIVASFNYVCFYLVELSIKHMVRNYELGYIDEQIYKEGIKGYLDYYSEIYIKDENDRKYELDKEKIEKIIKKNISKC